MNAMTQTRKFFTACRRVDMRINARLEERSRVMALATRCTPSYTGMPHAGGVSNRVEDGVVRLDELERELSDEIDFYVRLRRLAHEVVRSIPDTRYQDILTLRYFNSYGWERVAEEMGYESNYIWRVHGYALLKAREALERMGASDPDAAAVIQAACAMVPDPPEKKFCPAAENTLENE